MAKNNWAKEAFRKAQNLLSREYGDFEPSTVVTKDELSTLKNTLLDDAEIQRQNEANWLKMEEPYEAETIGLGEPEPKVEEVLPQISAPFNLDLQKKLRNKTTAGTVKPKQQIGAPFNIDLQKKLSNNLYQHSIKTEGKDYNSFVTDWSKTYQTEQNPAKEKEALSSLKRNWSVPAEAESALDTASYIFEGDSGFTKEELYKYGANTGQVESKYKTKVQYGGGPARSYWQVEPETALDLLINSSAIFGPKFEEMFSEKYGSDNMTAREGLATLTLEEMSELLEEDDALAATLALGVYVRSR